MGIKKFKMRKRGSAILIVMLLITVLATVALTVGYLVQAEVTMETNSEDGSMAYHAAEAGIEEGLLRFRYDRNTEAGNTKNPAITNRTINAKPCDQVGNNRNCVERVDITGDKRQIVDLTANPENFPNNPLNEYYDLKVWYQSDTVGAYDDFTANAGLPNYDYVIKKDQSFEMLGNPQNNVTVDFRFLMVDPLSDSLLEVKVYNQNGSSTNNYFNQSGNACGVMCTRSFTIPVNGRAMIKPWMSDVKYAARYKAVNGNATKIDSGYTFIESTGYYGSAKRKLQAKIDRKTGKLLEIFDFVLGSNTTIN